VIRCYEKGSILPGLSSYGCTTAVCHMSPYRLKKYSVCWGGHRVGHGLEEYLVKDFEAVCREVFDDFFARHRFGMPPEIKPPRVRYTKESMFVDFSYYPEDAPKYAPMVTLGWRDAASMVESIAGLWALIPDTVNERSYSFWTFTNADTARDVLSRIRDDVLPHYALPLFQDPIAFRSLVSSLSLSPSSASRRLPE